MVLQIRFPGDHIHERTWVLKTIFSDFLGLEYNLVPQHDSLQYEIIVNPDKKLILRDQFFSNFKDNKSYLNKKNIPKEIVWIKNSLFPEGDFPVLFGMPIVEYSKSLNLDCWIDIPAVVFFMLTRWEEFVIPERDQHDRFPGKASLAYQNNFLSRPIVNEAVEFIWNCLQSLGLRQERKARFFEIIPTHDVDVIYARNAYLYKLLNIAKLNLSHKNVRTADTFHELMDLSERGGWISRFYFLGTGKSSNKFDNRYDPTDIFLEKRMKEIHERGHIIGFHPGYTTYLDHNKMVSEKNAVEKDFIPPFGKARQHYLRFRAPTTWRIQEKVGLSEDQTLMYADHEGFRCGTGDSYVCYDFIDRKAMNIKECPLILMDVSLTGKNYRNFSKSMVKDCISYYKKISRKYKMKLTVLYHNTYFIKRPDIWPVYKDFIIS